MKWLNRLFCQHNKWRFIRVFRDGWHVTAQTRCERCGHEETKHYLSTPEPDWQDAVVVTHQ